MKLKLKLMQFFFSLLFSNTWLYNHSWGVGVSHNVVSEGQRDVLMSEYWQLKCAFLVVIYFLKWWVCVCLCSPVTPCVSYLVQVHCVMYLNVTHGKRGRVWQRSKAVVRVRGCEGHCFIAVEVWGTFPPPIQAADRNRLNASSGLTHILYIWMVWRKRTFCPEGECIVNLASTPLYHTVASILKSVNLSHVGSHWWRCSHFTYNTPWGFLCGMTPLDEQDWFLGLEFFINPVQKHLRERI